MEEGEDCWEDKFCSYDLVCLQKGEVTKCFGSNSLEEGDNVEVIEPYPILIPHIYDIDNYANVDPNIIRFRSCKTQYTLTLENSTYFYESRKGARNINQIRKLDMLGDTCIFLKKW